MDTIFELDDVDKPQEPQEEKPKKKEPKIKKKKEMTEERKAKLREQLARGRKTLADRRAKKKEEQKPASEEKPVVKTQAPKQKKSTPKEKVEMTPPYIRDDDLRKEISELKNLVMESMKPKEPVHDSTPKKMELEEPKEPPKKKKVLPQESNVQSNAVQVNVAPPIPKKKKRSTFGGGMVLDFSKF